MNKRKVKDGIVIGVELDGINEVKEQIKELNSQLDDIINKFEKIAELSKLKINGAIIADTLKVMNSKGNIMSIDDSGTLNLYEGPENL